MPQYTSLVTLISVLFCFFIATRVAAARRKFGVQLPATTGHPDFERVFRVQQNTLEWMPIFLPSLWLYAVYVSDATGAALGLVWIVGRALYFVGYSKKTERRLPGFAIQTTACLVLVIGALVGLARGWQ